MDPACITTPFGRRPMTLGVLAKHRHAQQAAPELKRNKWKLFRAICEARDSLDVSDRSLTVLDALLSFYPSEELSAAAGLIVFPSNAQLSIRARGMTAATLRRHLAALVDAGLILRKDSPNGKRYARRSRAGDISDAFGFSLAPLLSRAREIEDIAAQISAERVMIQVTRERVSLCRREITKLIQAAIDASVDGDWSELHTRFRSAVNSLPRRAALHDLKALLACLTDLRARIVNLLEDHDKSQKMYANESQNERHIQDSQTYSHFESEPAGDAMNGRCDPAPLIESDVAHEISTAPRDLEDDRIATPPSASLETVLRACPDISHYGPGGSIRSWRDLVSACTLLGPMLQISASAFRDACRIMGPENTAIAVACIYARGGAINSAGAYLRDLSRRAARKEFTVAPMLSARLRSEGTHDRG